MKSLALETKQPAPAENNRWLQYQSERFPILQYAPLVAAFASSGLALSYMVTGMTIAPTMQMFLTAFTVALLTFLQLRVSDEIKDADFDKRFHPDRPVPRGLISLDELKVLALAAAAVQLILSITFNPILLVPLFSMWTYLYLMHNEFFVGEWLNRHQILYMLSHMGILFFTDFYITSCHWLISYQKPTTPLLYFFATSFMLGMVIEIGRKIKAPKDEIDGSNTYSRIWGRRAAVYAWLATLTASMVFAILTAAQIGFGFYAAITTSIMLALAIATALKYLQTDDTKRAKKIESLSGIWTLTLYLLVGTAPLVFKLFI